MFDNLNVRPSDSAEQNCKQEDWIKRLNRLWTNAKIPPLYFVAWKFNKASSFYCCIIIVFKKSNIDSVYEENPSSFKFENIRFEKQFWMWSNFTSTALRKYKGLMIQKKNYFRIQNILFIKIQNCNCNFSLERSEGLMI